MTYRFRKFLDYYIVLQLLLLSACATSLPPYSPTKKTVQKPYTVNGNRYEPLASYQGFTQDGVASSYGQDFNGRKTSSGELFDMSAMTAAHKTLPLGVYVKVRHKRNGKEVIVRINDRGPFVRERIIDLSDGAARKLDMIKEGLASVNVTALGYKIDQADGDTKYRAPLSYDSGSFALQVAALKSRTNAYRYADELRKKHGSAIVREATIGGNMFYRIHLGHYSSLRTAQSAQESFERKGFPGNFVVAVD